MHRPLAILFFWSIVQISAAEAAGFTIDHAPPAGFLPGEDLTLSAWIGNADTVDYCLVHYRTPGEPAFRTIFLSRVGEGGEFRAIIPGRELTAMGIEYFISVFDQEGRESPLFASAERPRRIVEPISLSRPEPAQPETATASGVPAARRPDLSEEFEIFSSDFTILSASRAEQKIGQSPSAITVFTAKDIANYGTGSIPDVLRLVPGMDFMQISNSDKNLNVRGFNREGSNKMLALVDGRPVYVDIFGITFWEALPVSADEVRKIEVIRGPGSALYGANAFSGVVSIYTRRPDEIDGLIYSLNGGPYGLSASLLTGDTRDRLGWKVSSSYRLLDSFDRKGEMLLESVRGNGAIEYRLTDDMLLSLDAGASRDVSDSIYSLIGPLSVNALQGYALARYTWNDLSARLYWTYLKTDIGFSVPLPPAILGKPISAYVGAVPDASISSQGNTLDFEGQYTHNFGAIDRLTGGIEFRGGFVSSPDLEPGSSNWQTYSIYLQNEFFPLTDLTIGAGVRYDLLDVNNDYTTSGGGRAEVPNIHGISPRGSIVYTLFGQHTFRVSSGLAFRNPAYFESNLKTLMLPGYTPDPADLPSLYVTADRREPVYYQGRPDLGPEKLLSVEAGYGTRLWERLNINIDFFYNRYSDIILFNSDVDGLITYMLRGGQASDIFTYNNDITAQNLGFEVEARYRPLDWLHLFANYAFQRVSILNKGDLLDDYVARYNEVLDPGSVLQKSPDQKALCFSDDPATASDNIACISTLESESPAHKLNFGVNAEFLDRTLSVNLYGHFQSGTRRQTFLTRLVDFEYLVDLSPAEPIRYNLAYETRSAEGATILYGVSSVPAYVTLNVNIGYKLLGEALEVGLSIVDLTHLPSLWQNVSDYGFTLRDTDLGGGKTIKRATGIKSPRYVQYPRHNLFGLVTGGEAIPTQIYCTLKGRF